MYSKSMSRGIMKEMELKTLKSLSGFFPLKKTMTHLLISVSIFSLVFSWSYLSSSTLVYYQNLHYFSTNSCYLISIAMNKNCIFLICNGILVFLAKTSPPPAPDLDDVLQKRIGDGLQVETEAETLSDKHMTSDEEDEETKAYEAEEVEGDREFEHSSEGSVQVSISIAESDEEGGNDGRDEEDYNEIELQDCCLFDDVDYRRDQESNGGEEVDEIGKLSDDELNQKFEDFIRRMKEEFRINEYQQQQLVLVK